MRDDKRPIDTVHDVQAVLFFLGLVVGQIADQPISEDEAYGLAVILMDCHDKLSKVAARIQ